MDEQDVRTAEVVKEQPIEQGQKKAGFRGFLKAHRQGIIGGLIGVAAGAILGVAGHKVYLKKADVKATAELPVIPEVASDTSTDNTTL